MLCSVEEYVKILPILSCDVGIKPLPNALSSRLPDRKSSDIARNAQLRDVTVLDTVCVESGLEVALAEIWLMHAQGVFAHINHCRHSGNGQRLDKFRKGPTGIANRIEVHFA